MTVTVKASFHSICSGVFPVSKSMVHLPVLVSTGCKLLVHFLSKSKTSPSTVQVVILPSATCSNSTEVTSAWLSGAVKVLLANYRSAVKNRLCGA